MATVGFTGTALAYNLYDLILWRSLCALGYAMVFVAAQGYVLDRTGHQNRAQGFALFIGAIMVATVCGPSIGGILADNIGFRASFGVSALMALVSIFAINRLPAVERSCRASDKPVRGPRMREIMALIVNKRFMTLTGLAAVPAKIILTGVCFYLVPLYIVSIGNTSAMAGRMLMVYAVMMVLIVPISATLSDATMRRDRYVSVGLIISGLSGLLLLLSESFLVLFGVVFLLGLGQALSIAAQSALVADHCQEEIRIFGSDAVYGVYRLLERLGNALGPLIASVLVIMWGYQGAFIAISATRALLRHRVYDRDPRFRMAASRGAGAPMIRAAIAFFLAAALLAADHEASAQQQTRPYRIYAITFRGMTDVEKGFQDYFAARHIPVQITFRDLNRDNSRMAGFVEEIRRTKPDLIYTWGTSVTLGVVGAYDQVDPTQNITDIPVVFTLVAAPVLAKIVRDLKNPGRNVTGVYHVAPTETQIRAMASYRPFKSLGILYTPTEQNSVVVVEEVREVSKRLGFTVVAKPLRLDANKKVTSEGAADMVRDMKLHLERRVALPAARFLPRHHRAEGRDSRGDVRGPSRVRVDGAADGDRGAHGPREPLPLDRPVHRVQGRADPREQGAALEDPGGDPDALRFAGAHGRGRGAEASAAAADVQLRRADRPETRGPHPGHHGRAE